MKTKQRAARAARTLSGGCISANTQTEVQKWTQQESKCRRLTSAREQNCFLIHSFTRHWRFSADLMSIYNELRGRDPEVRSSGLFSFLFLSPLSSGSAPCLPLHRGGFTGRTKSEMKNCHKKEFKPRGVPPILKRPTVLTAKTTTGELFCGHVAAFEANPRPVDRSLTAINNNKREIAATSSKGKWRMKAKLQGSGPETWYAEKISHPDLCWPVQSRRTHDAGLTHSVHGVFAHVRLWLYWSQVQTPEASNSPFLYKRVNESDDKEMWENELQTDTKLTMIGNFLWVGFNKLENIMCNRQRRKTLAQLEWHV